MVMDEGTAHGPLASFSLLSLAAIHLPLFLLREILTTVQTNALSLQNHPVCLCDFHANPRLRSNATILRLPL